MRIIISPAKKMNTDTDKLGHMGMPVFLDKTEQLLDTLRSMSFEECKAMWGCSDKIAEENYERVMNMELEKQLTPAILSYEGIQYQYMASKVLETGDYAYLQEHLRILSGFYGVLKPFDGIVPYRLEMQSPLKACGKKDLYDLWGDSLYKEVIDESRVIINLASKEYSKCIERYLAPGDRFITVVFGELSGGKVVQKGTYAKMARGEMVHYMAENGVEDPEGMKGFGRLGYTFRADLSTDEKYVFVK